MPVPVPQANVGITKTVQRCLVVGSNVIYLNSKYAGPNYSYTYRLVMALPALYLITTRHQNAGTLKW
jgi:hypothetical protein